MAESMQAKFPPLNPTISYWLSNVDPEIDNYCSNNGTLPAYADKVIIGSGISGALISHHLLECESGSQPCGSVVMLESRSLCSGATGRNGGHIKPDCYRNFSRFAAYHGQEEAKKQCEFEMHNRCEALRLVKALDLADAIDLVDLRSADVFMTQDGWIEALSSYNSLKQTGADVSMIKIFDAQEALDELHIKDCYGAITFPACSLWPRKLVCAVITKSLTRGMQLYTHTTATGIKPSIGRGNWQIETSRGPIECAEIFHATNGYVSNLLPEFSRKIVPVKGNILAIQPSQSYCAQPIAHTYGIQWGRDFDYLIQRPTDGKPFIYGGGDLAHPHGLLGPMGDSDDTTTNPSVLRAIREFPQKHFLHWNAEEDMIRYAWSGIMGFTSDGFPYVGEVPQRPGQWIAAGFNGHGMARVFITIKALCDMARGGSPDPRLPQGYLEIATRMKKKDEAWETMLHAVERIKNDANQGLRGVRQVSAPRKHNTSVL